ncbi:AzlC family ABC transporter permease [Aestuariivita sp.]|jgi:predicted branched-subunit amino acid permease|uniref:AzlC family ABC transporter permease n=1 Tax=Aestuariivita sp. TaxID=1872407 RepID=UPI00216D7F37|nr:AzlC family ABC transporter permease [Aestuariivita sp.]MCE8009214.1 AzlC family ABC transporter permease [Aestuariivita sp.]
MTSTTTKSAFWRGFRDGAPFVLVVAPFAMLFGVLATEAGLSVLETLLFSVAVVAGAAQFTALQLLVENAPTAIILASALAVNLRMAMYSASLTPHLGGTPLWQRAIAAYFLVDQSYACSIAQYEKDTRMTQAQKVAYFFGTVAPVCPMWYVFTLVGALVGNQIPPEWALDFAVPITFLALTVPMLRTAAHVVAALVAIAVAIMANGMPFNLALIIAGVVGMMAGAQTELWLRARGRWI